MNLNWAQKSYTVRSKFECEQNLEIFLLKKKKKLNKCVQLVQWRIKESS